MLVRILWRSALALWLAFVSGCTVPVDPPRLTRRVPVPLERVALGPNFDKATILRIVDALGEGLKDTSVAAALREAVEDFYTDAHRGLRDELEQIVLDEADDRSGLLAQLELRAQDPATGDRIRKIREEIAVAPWKPLVDVLRTVAESDATAPLAQKSAALMDPRWTDTLPPFATEPDDRIPALVGEMVGAFGKEDVRKSMVIALRRTFGGSAAAPLLEAVTDAFENGDGEFRAFAGAVERAVKTSYRVDGKADGTVLEGLLRLSATLDRPSDGLFAAAEAAFAADPALRNLAASLLRVEIAAAIGRTTTRALLEDLDVEVVTRWAEEEDLDGEGFRDLFGRIVDGFQQVLGPLPGETDVLYGSVVVGRVLPCYALARWYQAGLRAAAKELRKLPADDFAGALSRKVFDIAASNTVFGKAANGNAPIIDAGFEKSLKAIGYESALPAIRAAISGKIAPLNGRIAEQKAVALAAAMESAVKAWDRTRPLADALPTVRTLLDDLAQAPKGWLAAFDGANMLNGLHLALRALPVAQLPRLRKLLFVDLELQKLSPNARELLSKLVEKAPNGEAQVNAILRDLGALAEFSAPWKGSDGKSMETLPFYRRVVASLPETGVDLPGHWLRLARALALGSPAATKALPTVHQWLASPDSLTRVGRWLADWPGIDAGRALVPVAGLFPKAFDAPWNTLLASVAAVASPLTQVLQQQFDAKGQWRGTMPFTDAERRWLAAKAGAGAWTRAGVPGLRWLRGATAVRLWPLFRRWATDGTWRRLFEELQWAKDPRLARWARCLRQWENSGAWNALFLEPAGLQKRSPLK